MDKLEFYSIKEIAEMFKISYKVAYNLVHSEGFPKIVVGKVLRVPHDELEKWIKKYSYCQYLMK